MRALVIAILVTACGHAATPAATTAGPDTQLVVSRSGDAWSLAFAIENRTASAIDATYMYPFSSFQLAVTDAHGAALPLAQPAYDMPVEPRTLAIAAHARATLPTPIRVRFAAAADVAPNGGDDPFVWTIRAVPQPVTLTATFALPGLGARTAAATLTP
jgi:hypothetical protein